MRMTRIGYWLIVFSVGIVIASIAGLALKPHLMYLASLIIGLICLAANAYFTRINQRAGR
jgi:hypothetical protein